VSGAGGRYRRPAVVACSIAVAAIAGLAAVSRLRAAGRPPAPPGVAAAAGSDDDLAAISAEVKALRNEVRTLRSRAAQAQPGVPIPSPTCDLGTRASHEQDPPSLAADHERAVTQGARLDDRLAAELRDSTWAPAFEETLRKVTESALTDPGAESIARADCRSTLCRLEVRHPDASHGDSFQTRFRLAMPDVVYRVSQAQNDDGSYSSVFHIIRKGEPIPPG
jgi:hypothetical protein